MVSYYLLQRLRLLLILDNKNLSFVIRIISHKVACMSSNYNVIKSITKSLKNMN